MKFLKRMMIAILTVATLISVCSCANNPFKKKEKSYEEYKSEVVELSMRLAQKMIAGDYDTVSAFIPEDAKTKQIEQIIRGVSPELKEVVNITMGEVSVLPGSYSSDIHFKTTIIFKKSTYSFTFVIKLERSGESWHIINMTPLASDIRTLNQAYLDGKVKDEE